MQRIFLFFIILKVTNCEHMKEVNENFQKSKIRITKDGEIYVSNDQDINDDEVSSLLEEKYKFFNDNKSRRYKTLDSEEIKKNDDEVGVEFRAVAERRIIGGMQTSIRMYPYNVAIARHGKHWCGGSVVDEQWVLTAGHCMESAHDGDRKKLNPFVVRAGSSFHNRGGYQARVNKAFFPSDYSPGHADYDFSLLRLDRPMPIGRNIAVINLPSVRYRVTADDMLVVTGWGSTAENGVGNVPDRMRFVPVPVIKENECQNSYHFYITPRMVCAGYKNGGMDACNHDSGGPAMRDGVLIGVVSFGGKKCGDPKQPGVYGRVSQMTDWVARTISNNEAHEVPELRGKIERARLRERELHTFKVQLEEKKMKIKNWLREMLYTSTFVELAKKKLEEVGIQVRSMRRFDPGKKEIDDKTLDDINLTNLITENILEDDITNEKETLLKILALYEMTNGGKEFSNDTEYKLPRYLVDVSKRSMLQVVK